MSSSPASSSQAESRTIRCKPMVQATRVTLFEREVRERLAESALELLLDQATLIAEGEVADGSAGQPTFFGTAMFTLDVERLSGLVRETCDEAAALRVAALVDKDLSLQRRLQKLAQAAAEARCGRRLRAPACELRVRSQGTRVLVDIDLEGALG